VTAKIKVMVVDDVLATRQNIGKLLEFHPEIAFVGEADCAEAAIEKAKALQPDIILMDINMPGMDGITATNIISNELPNSSIIIMSVQGEQEYLRRAMTSGAKDYLTKPFTGDELVQAIKQVYSKEQNRKKVVLFEPKPAEPGKIITVFSTKGGVGKTTISSNLAVALAEKTGARVGLVDADLQFGDIALFLNLLPRATVSDLVRDIDSLDEKLLEGYLTSYSNNLQVLAAPLRPEQAETITTAHLATILKTMRKTFKYIIVDTTPAFSDMMLTVLDISDTILLTTTLDLPSIKNAKLCVEIMESLGYAHDKVKLILNRANAEGGMDISEAEDGLRASFTATLPSDGKLVMSAVNRGIPFVASNPEAPVSQGIFKLAKMISAGDWTDKAEPKSVVSKFKRLFG
jgi:pilus assembly protein CpaE